MPRAKNSVASRARRRKMLKMAKGYYSSRSRQFIKVKEAVTKALKYAYRDRRNRKRAFRSLWIARINAAVREHGINYSTFMNGLTKMDFQVDRKILSDLAISEKAVFAKIVEMAKKEVTS